MKKENPNLTKTVEYYYERVLELRKSKPDDTLKLPGNAYFLNDSDVVCFDRKFGVSRQPYHSDGLTMWCRSSGYISVLEGQNTIFRFIRDGEEPCIVAYAGFYNENGTYTPISITGVAKRTDEPKNIDRFTVFTPTAAYYFACCFDTILCLRAFVTDDKQMVLSSIAINKSNSPKNIYLSVYADPILRYMNNEDFESYWFKSSEYISDNGFVIHSSKDSSTYLGMNVKNTGNVIKKYVTTSRTSTTGRSDESFSCSESFSQGKFADCIHKSAFKDNSVAAEITQYHVGADEFARTDYAMKLFEDDKQSADFVNSELLTEIIDSQIPEKNIKNNEIHRNINLKFNDKIFGKDSELFNRFIESIKRQAYFCAMGKNYCGSMIGIRDVYQQLEVTTYWCPEESGERLVKYLNYISPTGRTPRQITVTENDKELPPFDTREFVDQGLWIVNSFYTYLCYTGDYKILDIDCGYYEFDDKVKAKSDKHNTVLEHLITIMQYLENNLDSAYTGCLRALYGDWNDALDGLGKTDNTNQKFGTGVSVMATLQFYSNLGQMEKILSKVKKFPEIAEKYKDMRCKLASNLLKYAVVSNENGEKRVLHGWGDKRGYLVGSHHDSDGVSRDSLATNAYWVISGMYEEDINIKPHILSALNRLDSKYGLKTFEPYFAKDAKGVGRIVDLPRGTAENSCAYIHASLFGIMSLFQMGESELAWKQLEKSIVITHDKISSTSYVMPNSWCHNEELGIDGESMSDWHTGSGAVLLKILVGHIFGVQPTLDGIVIRFPKFFPTNSAKAMLNIRGKKLVVEYRKNNIGQRMFEYNGVNFSGIFNEGFNGIELFIPYTDFIDGGILKITD